MAEYGKQLMKTKFSIDPSYTLVNHGSFGLAGKEPFQLRIELIKEMETQPDIWFRQNITKLWKENLEAVSDFLGSKYENLVFVNNTTTGISCILRSLQWLSDDEILVNSWTYGAVKNAVKFLELTKRVCYRCLPFPDTITSSNQIIDAFDDCLSRNHKIKLVILDVISCMPPSLMPLQELIGVCRKFGKFVLVDGAHAPGQVNLNLETLGCDFFTGNLHKWCYAPRGCAVLWVAKEFHEKVFPAVISRLNTDGQISDMFHYRGTSDDTTFYCSRKSISFYNELGGYDNISKYCSTLVEKAANLLAESWKTEHFHLPEDMKAPFMRLVGLPKLRKYPFNGTADAEGSVVDMADMMADFWQRFKVQCCFVVLSGRPWVRISANVYNSLEDFQNLADAMLTLVKEDETSG